MLIANFTQSLQISRGRDDITTLADDRFDEDGCGVGGCGLLGEDKFELVERLTDEFVLGHRRFAVEMVPVWEGRREGSRLKKGIHKLVHVTPTVHSKCTDRGYCTNHKRCHAQRINRLTLRDCHSSKRPSVISTLHSNDVWSACDYAGHFDSTFDGLRA